jgi:hypothetical protein
MYTFNSWIILVHEVALNELDGKSRLADTYMPISARITSKGARGRRTTTAHDNQLVLPKEGGLMVGSSMFRT